MQTIKKIGITILGLALPLAAAAANDTITPILNNVKNALNIVIVIMFALVIIYFIWGVVQYLTAGGDEEKLKNGKQHMLWGIIGIAIVGAIWGIASFIWDYFGIQTGTGPTIPSF